MKRRDFFRSCVAAVSVCALPAPELTKQCLTITAGDYYATVSIGDKVFTAARTRPGIYQFAGKLT